MPSRKSAGPRKRRVAPAKRQESPSIDEYIRRARPDVRPILTKIRRTIRDAVPSAEETISYQIPAFRMRGILLYFAAFKTHIGIYPPVTGSPALEKALAKYRGPKRNLIFPLDEPIPYALIARVARERAKQDAARGRPKKSS